LAFAAIPINIDTIYHKDIASLRLASVGAPLSIAVIELNTDATLMLQFDDLRSGNRRYRYEIFHADKNWNIDDLNEIDYIQGFNRSQIKTFAYSTNRNIDYTHYSLRIPNTDWQPKISGNYIMHVYEDLGKDQREYIFTRRFMIYDKKVTIQPLLVRPTDLSKYRTHHELDVHVNIKDFPIYNSRIEITLSVMQNGRWCTLIGDIKQNRDKVDHLVFDYLDKISFPAGKEFRYFDIRSLRFRSRFVKKITENMDETIVTLTADKIRDQFNYITDLDADGNYMLFNNDRPEGHISSEYAWVDFTLQSPEFSDNKVYIIGAFTDWQCKEDFLMKYDLASSSYIGSAFLKQGYYNYAYAVMDKQGNFNLSVVDGDWYETENEYQFMLYYRPFGTRYDQLIAFKTLKSTSN
jgi:hypothetical protein